MARCKYCGEEYPEKTKFCPNCGKAVEPVLTEAEFVVEEPEASPPIRPTEPAAAPHQPRVESERKPGPEKPRVEPERKPGPEKPRVEPERPAAQPPRKKVTGLSVAAFICSLTVLLSGLGAILAIVDLVKAKTQPRKKGLSVAALVVCGVFLLLGFIGRQFVLPRLMAEEASAKPTAYAEKVPLATAKGTGKADRPASTAKPRATAESTKPPAANQLPDPSEAQQLTKAEKDEAVKEAKLWLNGDGVSYQHLIKALMANGFSQAKAVYAVNHCGADWYEEAVRWAKNEQSYYSYARMIEDMMTEWQFTAEEAEYGVTHADIDWNKQALNFCQMLFDSDGGWSHVDILAAMARDEFTSEQIAYAEAHWTVDFKEQAVKFAQFTLKANANSDEWIRQRENFIYYLESSGHFTQEEAIYAADKLGIK